MSDPLLDHPHNYYNHPPSNAWMGSTADSVGLALTTIFVFARCYTKFFITKVRGWEDYTCILALVTFILFVTFNFVQRFQYGSGRHSWDLPPEYWEGNFWTGMIDSYLYILGVCIAKVSLLLLLYRVFRVDFKFRIASWAIGFVVVVWTTVSLLLCIFSCKPISASWKVDVRLDPATKCPIKSYDVINIHGFCNVITDFALLILPIPMVWRLQMGTKKKLGLAAVFSTGIFICAVSIVRQYILYSTNKTGDNYKTTKIKVWISLELSFSIVVACLPALTPLFRKISGLASLITTLRSKVTRSQKSQKLSGPSQDIEQGALRSDQYQPSSWQVPGPWKESEKRNSDDYDAASHGSAVTLQELNPSGHTRIGTKGRLPTK